jgi:hypothetical protein
MRDVLCSDLKDVLHALHGACHVGGPAEKNLQGCPLEPQFTVRRIHTAADLLSQCRRFGVLHVE